MSKPARRDGTPERNEHNRDVESYISNARPARHQHVADRKPPKKAGGQGNQKKRTKSDNEKTRLQKVLAAAGVASRRMSEKLIEAGRVEVNGSIVTEQGMRVDPENDVIRVDGVRVIADEVQIIDAWQGKSLIKVVIHEGRKHVVRRMLKEAGFPVQALVRTKVHTVQLGEQKPGTLRALNRSELTSLYNAVGL